MIFGWKAKNVLGAEGLNVEELPMFLNDQPSKSPTSRSLVSNLLSPVSTINIIQHTFYKKIKNENN